MGMIDSLLAKVGLQRAVAAPAASDVPVTTSPANQQNAGTTEVGRRPTQENQMRAVYRQLQVDYDLRATILDIRTMDRQDGRVKRIHNRVARDVTRGGLVLLQDDPDPRVRREWEAFVRRLQLNRPEKLKSDAVGLLKEGNLPMQWVLDGTGNVVSGVRMPTETIRPNVGIDGRFKDVRAAYTQMDLLNGTELATFPLWQLTVARLDPDSSADVDRVNAVLPPNLVNQFVTFAAAVQYRL